MTDQMADMIETWKRIESPYMAQHRAMIARHEQGERAIRLLPVYRIIGIMGWLAFLAVVIVAGMK